MVGFLKNLEGNIYEFLQNARAKKRIMMDLGLWHNYEVEILEELPSGIAIYYYPGASIEGGKDGLLIEVTPSRGEPWVGVFAFGDLTPKGVTGIYTSPDPDRLCVVSKRGRLFCFSNQSC